MRDTSVPTPAIVDARLIEAPFEVVVLAEKSRRAQLATAEDATQHEMLGMVESEVAAPSAREQRRAAKAAEKERKRHAKVTAKAETKVTEESQAKVTEEAQAKVTAEAEAGVESEANVELDVFDEAKQAEPEPMMAPSADAGMLAPRATSSFDELMGYSEK